MLQNSELTGTGPPLDIDISIERLVCQEAAHSFPHLLGSLTGLAGQHMYDPMPCLASTDPLSKQLPSAIGF
jgi:hypothetical protein